MSLRITAMAAVLSVIGFASPVWAATFDNIVLSSEEDADEGEDVFAADTPVIHLSADLANVGSASKVTVSWICVDSGGAAPANYVIDSVDMDLGSLINHVNSRLSKPNAGWPQGEYRVDLAVDSDVVDSVEFSVE